MYEEPFEVWISIISRHIHTVSLLSHPGSGRKLCCPKSCCPYSFQHSRDGELVIRHLFSDNSQPLITLANTEVWIIWKDTGWMLQSMERKKELDSGNCILQNFYTAAQNHLDCKMAIPDIVNHHHHLCHPQHPHPHHQNYAWHNGCSHMKCLSMFSLTVL